MAVALYDDRKIIEEGFMKNTEWRFSDQYKSQSYEEYENFLEIHSKKTATELEELLEILESDLIVIEKNIIALENNIIWANNNCKGSYSQCFGSSYQSDKKYFIFLGKIKDKLEECKTNMKNKILRKKEKEKEIKKQNDIKEKRKFEIEMLLLKKRHELEIMKEKTRQEELKFLREQNQLKGIHGNIQSIKEYQKQQAKN